MSMTFNALRALEMEQRERQGGSFLSALHLSAPTVSSHDLSARQESAKERALHATRGDAAKGRPTMDKEQLQALRCQVEEEYKLDIAAIQWLQQRYSGISSSGSYSQPSESAGPQPIPESRTAPAEAAFESSVAPVPMAAPAHLSAPADRRTDSTPGERRIDDPKAFARAEAERWMQGAHR
jgi:hypothetical protein